MTLLIFNIVATLFIILYLVVARSGIFAEATRQLRVADNRLENNQLQISQLGSFIWLIKKDDWDYEGDAKLSIVFQRNAEIPFEKYDREKLSLRIKVNAFGVMKDGTKHNRIIRDWYYNTDNPLSSDATIWSRFGPFVEYGLAGITRRPNEDLEIEVIVTTPDLILSQTQPSLRIVGDHHSSAIVKIMLARYVDLAAFTICIVLLIVVNILCALF